MPEVEGPSRPTAVTVIGWLWLVMGVLFLFRALINLIVWRILQPDLPDLLELDRGSAAQVRFLRPIFENFTAIHTVETIVSAAVIVLAIQFLRLRDWARAGLQVVCWFALAFVAAFGSFWFWLWRRIAESPQSPARPLGTIGLLTGLAVCLALATGLVLMIAMLRSRRVRGPFRHRLESTAGNSG